MTAPCPHCGAPCDLTRRLTGDRLWCAACNGWFVVRFTAGGGAQLTKAEAPATWPKEKKVRE